MHHCSLLKQGSLVNVNGFLQPHTVSDVNKAKDVEPRPKSGVVPKADVNHDKKLSYRRETARQLHTSFSAHSLIVHFTEHRICFTTI